MKTVVILMSALIMSNNKLVSSITLTMFLYFTKMNLNNSVWVSFSILHDSISFWVILLTMWIFMLTSLIKITNPLMQVKINSTMLLILYMVFSSWDFLMFFVLFEMSMMVIVIMVMMWGYQPDRIEATLFMVFFTTMFSLPFFVTLMKASSQLNFWFLTTNLFLWDYLSFLLIFVVKLPVYFIHIWLPKIHVEAPVQGSMVLASIMLKLGCYGLIRMTDMSIKINNQWESKIMAFSLWSALLLSMASAIQIDLKSMIAYSSIVHMTTVFMSITLAKSKSMIASIMMMVGHGLCSSALFFVCNNLYKHSKSRSMLINKGMLTQSPALASLWFIICMSNAPMPPSINMMGEILAFKSAINWSPSISTLLATMMFMSSYFSIVLFYVPSHSKFSNNLTNPMITSSKNLTISWLHTAPLISLILKSSLMEL